LDVAWSRGNLEEKKYASRRRLPVSTSLQLKLNVFSLIMYITQLMQPM
jgi:hypothetical protein